jgi:methionyl aminopeptidase
VGDINMRILSRNDSCWCGSGKKYKKCHMEQDMVLYSYQEQGYTIPPRGVVKTSEQIEGIRKSGELTRKALDLVTERIKAGVTTEEINRWVHDFTIENGAYPAPLNYKGFPKSVCTSINNVICHGIPGHTVLKDGDIVNVDVTTILDGYYADASRMFMIGEVSKTARNLVEVARECLYIGIDQVKPYTPLNNVGNAIEEHAVKNGFSVVRDFGGHGLGIQFHEFPHVDHYKRRDKGVLLVPNMVLTIEPMINEGSFGCKILEDGWTAVTSDGSLSAQWEHTIRVTEDGYEILV